MMPTRQLLRGPRCRHMHHKPTCHRHPSRPHMDTHGGHRRTRRGQLPKVLGHLRQQERPRGCKQRCRQSSHSSNQGFNLNPKCPAHTCRRRTSNMHHLIFHHPAQLPAASLRSIPRACTLTITSDSLRRLPDLTITISHRLRLRLLTYSSFSKQPWPRPKQPRKQPPMLPWATHASRPRARETPRVLYPRCLRMHHE